MRRALLRPGLVATVLSATLLLAGCASSAPEGGGPAGSTSGGKIAVVTSTNVYGNIAEVVGGNAVAVTSIVSDPAQDPHSYQASTKIALQLSKAQLVIENGGGYDDFVDTMLKAGKGSPVVLNAVAISGLQAPAGGELNEHIWYSLPSVAKIADQVATELGRIDPARSDEFRSNAETFDDQLDVLVAAEAKLKDAHAGEGLGITEPVPLYLTEAAGLINLTPPAFSKAVEEGEDVSVAVLEQTLSLYRDGKVAVLVDNEQTSGPVTDQVIAAAKQAGVPVVPVTETLPQGQTYLSWMQDNLTRLGRALEQ